MLTLSYLVLDVASVSAGLLGKRSQRSRDGFGDGGTGSGEGLAGLVPVDIELEKGVAGLVELSRLGARGDGGGVVAASDLDVGALGPELALGNVAVVVDRHDLSAHDVVAVGDAGDLDGLCVAVLVEDGVGTPEAGLLLGRALGEAALAVVDQAGAVDLEELERGGVDLGAVAVAGSEVGGGIAVVTAVPADLTATALALVLPGEGDVAAGGGLDGVRGGGGADVADEVGGVDRVAVNGLVSPALLGPPGGRLVAGVLLGSRVETWVLNSANDELLNRSVGGGSSEQSRSSSESVGDLGHGRHREGNDGNWLGIKKRLT